MLLRHLQSLASAFYLTRLRQRIVRRQPTQVVVIGSHPCILQLLPARAHVEFLRADQDQEIRALRNTGCWDEILVAPSAEEISCLHTVLEALQALPVPVRVALELPGAAAVRRKEDLLLVDVGLFPGRRFSYAVVKRALDIVIASAALVLGVPLAAAIALAIKASSPGPALFAQELIGWNGRRFTLYKFRTLPVGPPDMSEHRWSDTAPPEAGSLGRVLRRLGLDEWPQCWNVLRGEMSVVGPRPERPHFAEGFGQALESYSLRQRLKPGITGWAQIHGLTGASDISRRLEYDLYYLRNWSLGLDLKILLRTPLRALWRRAATVAPTLPSATSAPEAIPEVRDHARSF